MDRWDMYFASIVAMQYHPGYNREGVAPMSLEECAEVANYMIKEREESCPLSGLQ